VQKPTTSTTATNIAPPTSPTSIPTPPTDDTIALSSNTGDDEDDGDDEGDGDEHNELGASGDEQGDAPDVTHHEPPVLGSM